MPKFNFLRKCWRRNKGRLFPGLLLCAALLCLCACHATGAERLCYVADTVPLSSLTAGANTETGTAALPVRENRISTAATEPVTADADTMPSVALPPATPERQTPLERTDEVPSKGDTVYFTSGGTVWHKTPDCSALSRSAEILTGTVDDAVARGKTRGCLRCCGSAD